MTVTREELRRRFRRHGLRMTPQRVAIYTALVETSSHPTAEWLLTAVRRLRPRTSANTVYYTLGALRDAGLVQEVNYGHGSTRFDGNIDPHHHVICRGCRRIFDVQDRTLDRLTVKGGLPREFIVTGHRVEVYGYCAECRKGRVGRRGARRGPALLQHRRRR